MASRSTNEKWLRELTHLPTASGAEDAVVSWARSWALRRDDLRLTVDDGGNLLVTQRGRKSHAPVLAVAHMDHPAFVVSEVVGKDALFEFRGGVRPEYFVEAAVEFVTGRAGLGRVVEYEPGRRRGVIRCAGTSPVPGDLATWRMAVRPAREGRLSAPACDDLAGVAAALAALDRSRGRPELRHYGVVLTRAEEMGFIGAIHAARSGIIPEGSRLLSIEASRASTEAPIGGGPVIRVGDAVTVFDPALTNLISTQAMRSGIPHQRKLMAGGACEATALGAFGYRTTGLCLALGNYHNMGNLEAVESGRGRARPMMEEISLSDFHALVDLLLVAAAAVDGESDLVGRLEDSYMQNRHLLAVSRGPKRS